jgi:tripartite ATP-independent transporter DctP family solute receptor
MALGALNAPAAEINIDVNCTMKPGGSEEAAIKKFKEIVEAKSNGRMGVNIFMSGQLGKEKAVLELMKIGQTQMALTGGIFRTMFAKEYDPITIPFYLPTWDVVQAYLEGPMGQKIGQLAAEKGGVIDFGPQKRAARQMTSNKKIMGPDDIKGLKMRLPAIPIWVDVWKELGALPTVIPAPEIYLAMKTGQVEAHENSLVSPYSRKLWEVQKYIIETNHVYFPWHWVASKKWFDGLPKADQMLISDAVKEARAYGTQMEDQKDAFYAAELKKNGMQFITPDNKAIRTQALPAIQRAVDTLSPEVAAEVERLTP